MKPLRADSAKDVALGRDENKRVVCIEDGAQRLLSAGCTDYASPPDRARIVHTAPPSPAPPVGYSQLRVLYVTDRADAPFRYRCVNGCAQLRSVGVLANIARIDDPDLITRVPSYSMVILFRLPWSEAVRAVVQAARDSGAATAFEIDDLVFEPGVEKLIPFLCDLPLALTEEYRETFRNLAKTLSETDFCIASTQTIAHRARSLGKPALVHPNLLTDEHVTLSRMVAPFRRWMSRRPLIGYMSGSNTHNRDLESITEGILDAFRNRPELSLVLLGHIDTPRAFAPISSRVIRIPYLHSAVYPLIMARCRAVLAPIDVINDFTASKSALKVFEAGVFGVATVASPTPPYVAAIEQGVTGYVATTQAGWARGIEACADYETSLRMGRAARRLVLAEHAPAAWRGVLASQLLTYNGCFSGPRPKLAPTERVTVAGPVRRFRNTVGVVRQAFRFALGSSLGGSTSETAARAAALAGLIAATPRQDRSLVDNGHPLGMILVDREHPVHGLSNDPATSVFTIGRDSGCRLGCTHSDPQLLFPPLAPPPGCSTLVVTISVRTDHPWARFQLLWAPENDPSFTEERSVTIQVTEFDTWKAYAATLPPDAFNTGENYLFRIDPLDVPGEIALGTVALVSGAAVVEGPVAIHSGLAARFLRGRGMEIRAFRPPLPLPADTEARAVHWFAPSRADTNNVFIQGIAPQTLPRIDETTSAVPGSEDFVICDHVLQYTHDPRGVLAEWLRIVKPGGHLYVSIPTERNPLKPPKFQEDPTDSAGTQLDLAHRHDLDWPPVVHQPSSAEVQAAAATDVEAQPRCIHFHVFDRTLFERVLQHACAHGDAEIVELVENPLPETDEYIAVLRKKTSDLGDRPVDIVVPVYNARDCTNRCIQSVLRHATGDWRLVLVNDASTEDGIAEDLASFARSNRRVRVIENSRNLGFVATANRGMLEANGRDVLLLNSDTEVFEGFLDRMRAAIQEDSSTGILTPFSNNATICSIPRFPEDNPIPTGYSPEQFAKLVTACSTRVRPELPTGVGFCMWIRSEVLQRVGVLDEETFGRGYGEENDLCQRARKAGFRVRLCDDVFVYHKGKASFGAEGLRLEQMTAASRLEAKHPGYHAEIARFVESNPLAPLHRAIQFHLPRLRPGAERALLFMLHASPWNSRPGGTEFHVRDLLAGLSLPRVVVAWPEDRCVRAAEVHSGDVNHPVQYDFPTGVVRTIARHVATEVALRQAVESLGVTAAHIHHLLRWPLGVTHLLEEMGIPFACTHHDYYALCLNWNLYDHMRNAPCECSADDRVTCLSNYANATGALAGVDLPALCHRHRRAMDHLLSRARAHVFPSAAAHSVFERQAGRLHPPCHIIEHGYDAPRPQSRGAPGTRLRLALVGEVAYPIKGAEHYFDLLRRTRDLDLEWHVFGDVEPFGFGARLQSLGLGSRLVLHGRYSRHSLPTLLSEHGVDLCVIAPNWDETFSYVLSEALIAGVPALVSARGALPDRIVRSGAGTVVQNTAEAAHLLADLATDRQRIASWTNAARAYAHRPVAESSSLHRRLYEQLGWLSPAPTIPSSPRSLGLLQAVASASANGDTPIAAQNTLATRSPSESWKRLSGPLRQAIRNHPSASGPLRVLLSYCRALPIVGTTALRSPVKSLWRDLNLTGRTPWSRRFEALSADPQLLLQTKPFDPKTVRAFRFLMRHQLPDGAHAQLYWSDTEAGPFFEDNSAVVSLSGSNGHWKRYTIQLDSSPNSRSWRTHSLIVRLRFDPSTVPGTFEIGRIEFE